MKVKISLIENWKNVLVRSWSNRLAILSILLMAAEQMLPLLNAVPPEFRGFIPGWLPMVLMGLAVYARVVRQRAISGGK